MVVDIVLPRQGEVAPPEAVTEGAERNVSRRRALPLPPPPSCLWHATSPWRGRNECTIKSSTLQADRPRNKSGVTG